MEAATALQRLPEHPETKAITVHTNIHICTLSVPVYLECGVTAVATLC